MSICPICSTSFRDEKTLSIHVNQHFEPQEDLDANKKYFKETTWKCPQCTYANQMESLDCEVCSYSPIEPEETNQRNRHPRGGRSADTPPGSAPFHSGPRGERPSRQTTLNLGGTLAGGFEGKSHRETLEPLNWKTETANQEPSTSGTSRTRKRSSSDVEDQVAAWDSLLKRQRIATEPTSIIPKLEELLRRNAKSEFKLCHPTFLPSHQTFDRKWGCGYRNLQNIISCLWDHPNARQSLSKVFVVKEVPGIGELQSVLEQAWKRGFDPAGAVQLEHSVKGTQKWIGATEIVVILRSLRFRAELTDFRRPTTDEGTHPLLFETVQNYFKNPPPFGMPHPPIFLQYQGHSLTIIGYEKEDDRQNLLIFDPATTPERCKVALEKGNLRLFRYSLRSLSKPQYQIVQIEGMFGPDQEHTAKLLDSKSLP